MNSNLKNQDLLVLNSLKFVKAVILGVVCMALWARPDNQDMVGFFVVIGSYLAVVGSVSGVLYALTTESETNMRLTIAAGQVVWLLGALLKTDWTSGSIALTGVAFLVTVYFSLSISGGFRLKSGAF